MTTNSWWKNRFKVITVITTTIATITTIIRFTGSLETLELKRYDYLWTKKSLAQWDQRIVLVGYTDSDMEQYGESPPDKILRQVLQKIELGQPTTTGLLYRRQGKSVTPSERVLLEEQMNSMTSLIRSDYQNSFTPEPDNIIRKAQLYQQVSPTKKTTKQHRHFVWKVALDYLQKQGANIQENRVINNPSITITYPNGKTAFILPLTISFDGGYSAEAQDLRNFQVLVSWPASVNTAPLYSFEDILNNPTLNLKEKIVIVGNMANFGQQMVKTPVVNQKYPYKSRYTLEWMGIIISNILQQAEVPFVQVWRDEIEYLYFYIWMIISGLLVAWLSEELAPEKTWLKYLLGVAISWGVIMFSIGGISLTAFPLLWIPSVFIWHGVSFNIFFCSLACLELKVREEQQKRLEDKIKEQEKYLQKEQDLKQQQEIYIEQLKNTLMAQERLAFVGKLMPFLRHRLLNYYDEFNLNIDVNQLELEKILNGIQELVIIAESVIGEDRAEDKKEYLLDLIEEFNHRYNEQRIIIQSSKKLVERFLPMLRNKEMSKYLKPKFVKINDIIIESSRVAQFDFKTFHRNLTVQLNLMLEEETPEIWGLSSELQFAFVNVIENAYYAVWQKKQLSSSEYIPTVTIHSEVTQEQIRVKVSDNGIGISPAKSLEIFKPFYTTKQERQQTSGIGLTLTKDILEQHYHGNIYLDSQEDITCFVIELPLSFE